MRKNIDIKTLLIAVLFVAYLALLAKFMVVTHHVPSGKLNDYSYNLVPFKTILPYLTGYPNWIVARNNLLGNIILFMPLGFLLALLYRPISWKGVLCIAVALSLGIEILQLALRSGTFDVDDIILNTLGALLGYAVFIGSTHLIGRLALK